MTNAQRRRVLRVAVPVVGADSIAVAQRVQAWVLGSANERDAAAVLANSPRAAHVPLGHTTPIRSRTPLANQPVYDEARSNP